MLTEVSNASTLVDDPIPHGSRPLLVYCLDCPLDESNVFVYLFV